MSDLFGPSDSWLHAAPSQWACQPRGKGRPEGLGGRRGLDMGQSRLLCPLIALVHPPARPSYGPRSPSRSALLRPALTLPLCPPPCACRLCAARCSCSGGRAASPTPTCSRGACPASPATAITGGSGTPTLA